MKLFTEKDIQPPDNGWDGRMETGAISPGWDKTMVQKFLYWQKMGLQQTASGYGSKLTTPWMINFEGRLHRIYAVCWSNSGTCYFVTKGRRIVVS